MINAKESFSKEYKKTLLDAIITIKKDKPISMQITPSFQLPEIYQKMNIKVELPEAIPVEAKNRPLEAENIILQITKTNNTPYQFKNIKVNLDDGLFLPKISMLNELRRIGLQKVEEFALSNIRRQSPTNFQNFDIVQFKKQSYCSTTANICAAPLQKACSVFAVGSVCVSIVNGVIRQSVILRGVGIFPLLQPLYPRPSVDCALPA